MTTKDIMKVKVGRIMTPRVVTVAPYDDIREAARVLADHRISGALVTDRSGRPLGVLSTSDIVRFDVETQEAKTEEDRSFYETPATWSESEDEFRYPDEDQEWDQEDGRVATVADRMTERVIAVDVATPLPAVARLMVSEKVHRVFVRSEGKIVGVVSTMDIVRAVAGGN